MRGLPRGRVVLSSDSLWAVLLVHFSLPKGVPRTMLFLTTVESPGFQTELAAQQTGSAHETSHRQDKFVWLWA